MSHKFCHRDKPGPTRAEEWDKMFEKPPKSARERYEAALAKLPIKGCDERNGVFVEVVGHLLDIADRGLMLDAIEALVKAPPVELDGFDIAHWKRSAETLHAEVVRMAEILKSVKALVKEAKHAE